MNQVFHMSYLDFAFLNVDFYKGNHFVCDNAKGNVLQIEIYSMF